jgi:hypothetical protein
MSETVHQTPVSPQLIDPALLGKWLGERRHIWQMDLLSADKLSSFAKDRGLVFWSDHILRLWQLGLLRADIVVCDRKIRRAGFRYIMSDNKGQHLYADVRRWNQLPQNWRNAPHRSSLLSSEIHPLFHPFRYYVLYHLDNVLDPNIVPMQTLVQPKHYHDLLNTLLVRFARWAASPEFVSIVQKWNDTAALAIVTEPSLYQRLFGTLALKDYSNSIGRHYTGEVRKDWEILRKHIAQHWDDVAECYRSLNLEVIEKVWSELCFATQVLDPNWKVHTLLCLGYSEARLKLEGRLGGAMVLRTMAEIVRRASESAFDKLLPEEDDDWGSWEIRGEFSAAPRKQTVKEQAFGSNRLLDDWKSADEFARQFGLRYRYHIRWYLEGYTEYDGLRWLFFTHLKETDITFINLKGAFAEGGGKGLAFRESLRADIEARIFSFVSLDKESEKNSYVPALKAAAKNDQICGAFFVFDPEFERANFEQSEIEKALWILAQNNGASPDEYHVLQEGIQGWTNTDNLMEKARKALPAQRQAFTKGSSKNNVGDSWGEILMKMAWENPKRASGEVRPIIEAIKVVRRARVANYHLTRCFYRVDVTTGSAVRRSVPRETES